MDLIQEEEVLKLAAQIMRRRSLWSSTEGEEQLGNVLIMRYMERKDDRSNRKKNNLPEPALEHLH